MATVNFKIIPKNGRVKATEFSTIHVRYSESKRFDKTSKTFFEVPTMAWDKKKQRIKNNIPGIDFSEELNMQLQELETALKRNALKERAIKRSLPDDFVRRVVYNFFGQELPEEKQTQLTDKDIFFTSFCTWWYDERIDKDLNKKGTHYSLNQKKRLNTAKNLFIIFEKEKNIRIRFDDISNRLIQDMIKYLRDEKKYAFNSQKNFIADFKNLCGIARDLYGITIDENYNNKTFNVYEDKKEKHKEAPKPMLDFDEITALANLVPEDEKLLHLRDRFILGLITGMRKEDLCSTFSNEHIKGDYIDIVHSKTGLRQVFPITPVIRQILDYHNGMPNPFSYKVFNRDIKELCRMAKINKEIIAFYRKGNDTRAENHTVPKHEAISAHITRRSANSNYTLVMKDKYLVNKLLAWSTDRDSEMSSHYDKNPLFIYADKAGEILKKTNWWNLKVKY